MKIKVQDVLVFEEANQFSFCIEKKIFNDNKPIITFISFQHLLERKK